MEPLIRMAAEQAGAGDRELPEAFLIGLGEADFDTAVAWVHFVCGDAFQPPKLPYASGTGIVTFDTAHVDFGRREHI
jgi:hypothetical protein